MSHYDYRDHKTPHGIVEEEYNGYFIYNFTLHRPKDQNKPLTMSQIGEITEALIENYYEISCIYDVGTYKEEIPINLPLEIAKFQAQLMQQKYKFLDD
jgi:hypothetical protein